jgi:YD repeat-containing protein
MREDVRVLDFRDFGSRAIAEVTEIPEESRATMFDRDRLELRGPVKSCTEETTHPGVTDDEGKTYSAVHVAVTTEYDSDGRVLATRNHHPGGQSVSYFEYDASGRLLKVASGVEGQALTETRYSYDRRGRLENIRDASRPESPVSFSYDERGMKTKTAISRTADYRPNTLFVDPPSRLQTGHRTCRAEGLRPPSTTNMIGRRKYRYVMGTGT